MILPFTLQLPPRRAHRPARAQRLGKDDVPPAGVRRARPGRRLGGQGRDHGVRALHPDRHGDRSLPHRARVRAGARGTRAAAGRRLARAPSSSSRSSSSRAACTGSVSSGSPAGRCAGSPWCASWRRRRTSSCSTSPPTTSTWTPSACSRSTSPISRGASCWCRTTARSWTGSPTACSCSTARGVSGTSRGATRTTGSERRRSGRCPPRAAGFPRPPAAPGEDGPHLQRAQGVRAAGHRDRRPREGAEGPGGGVPARGDATRPLLAAATAGATRSC